jgi:hypothetical protein
MAPQPHACVVYRDRQILTWLSPKFVGRFTAAIDPHVTRTLDEALLSEARRAHATDDDLHLFRMDVYDADGDEVINDWRYNGAAYEDARDDEEEERWG